MGPLIALLCSSATVAASSTSTQTATATTGALAAPIEDDLTLDDLPLTDEDLALLAALDTRAATSTRTVEPHWWLAPVPLPRPTVLLPQRRIRESLARTAAETLDTFPTIADIARRYVPGESAIIRGQGGHRVALTMEGVPLAHALSSSRETAGWLTIDPWLLEEALIERPGSITVAPQGSAGSITFSAVEPLRTPGFEAEGELAARSADRSTSTHLAVGGASELVSVRVAGGYTDHRPLRISTSKIGQDFGSGYQRVAVGARARLFGRPDDMLRVYAGTDYDRVLNIERTDLTTSDPIIDRATNRLLGFARIDLGDDALGATLLAARQAFGRRFAPASAGNATTDERALTHYVRAALRARLVPGLVASAGGRIELGDAEEETPSSTVRPLGDTSSFEGFASLDLHTDFLDAYAIGAVVRAETSLTAEAAGVESALADTRLLTQGGARLAIAGPIGIRAGWSQGMYVPNVRDRLDGGNTLRAERSFTIDAGPSIYTRDGFLELLGFYTRIEDAIEPVSLSSNARLVNVASVALMGLELSGGLFLADAIRLAGVLTWTEGRDRASDAPVVTFPTVTGRASIRYDLPVRNAFLEAHVRGTSRPLYVLALRGAEPPASLAGLAPASFARAGIMGGVDLAPDLRLTLTLENVFDTAYRPPTSLVPGAGVDVRAALSYAWR